MIDELTKDAADAYGRIITRYPAMERAVDAKARLEALHQPVPRPTRKALQENEKEIASRQEASLMAKSLGTFQKGPDVSKAAHHGDPTMVDPEPMTATKVVRDLAMAAGGGSSGGNGKLAANHNRRQSRTQSGSSAIRQSHTCRRHDRSCGPKFSRAQNGNIDHFRRCESGRRRSKRTQTQRGNRPKCPASASAEQPVGERSPGESRRKLQRQFDEYVIERRDGGYLLQPEEKEEGRAQAEPVLRTAPA